MLTLDTRTPVTLPLAAASYTDSLMAAEVELRVRFASVRLDMVLGPWEMRARLSSPVASTAVEQRVNPQRDWHPRATIAHTDRRLGRTMYALP
jgi:hypothetical protein